MESNKIFVGRREELELWEKALADPQGQAILIVGQQGMGKTMLINKMADLACDPDHPNLKCGYVRYEVTPTDPPDTTMQLMIEHAFEAAQVVEGSFDLTERRRRQWRALFDVFPKGKELRELFCSLRYNPQRNTRDQFSDRLELISKRMPDNGRAIFVIDPEKYMPPSSADTWRLVIKDMPQKIIFLFAQRNDDQLIINNDIRSLPNVTRIPAGDLGVLDNQAYEHLLEIYIPKLKNIDYGDLQRALDIYNYHPYAVPAALEMLASGQTIEQLPPDPTPEGIAVYQWKLICQRGPEAIRYFRAFAILQVAVPDEVSDHVSEIDSATREHLLSDHYLNGLLRIEPEGRRIYHSLLSDHILATISKNDSMLIHKRAIDIYRIRLNRDTIPDSLAATRLPEHILTAEGNEAFISSIIDYTIPLTTLGLLDTYKSLIDRALTMVAEDSPNQAALIGNLGLIYKTQGDLLQADLMLRKALEIEKKNSHLEGMARCYAGLGLIYKMIGGLEVAEQMQNIALEINEKLGRLEGMSNAYSNLGVIYQMRGDLNRAEKMHHNALKIDAKLGRLEGMANQYGNLGLLYNKRDDLDQAEQMLNKSLEINEKLGRLEGIAVSYANLGIIYKKRGQINSTREIWKKSRQLFMKLGIQHRVNQIDKWLAELPPE